MGSKRSTTLALVGMLVMALCFAVACGSRTGGLSEEAVERHKRLAGELRDNRLYAAAVEEYRKILADEQLDVKARANINYLIGRIYFEDLQQYEEAAAYYIRARSLDPEGSFVEEASRKLIASLEKMGRVLDARRQLATATDVDAEPREAGDVVVARVGSVPVWRSEVEEEIQSLPPEMQRKFMTRQARVQFMRNYVASELLYRAAVREDYGSDPQIQKRQHQLYKKLLVDKYVVDNVIPRIQVDTTDVRNYYAAHKQDRYNNAPYDSVKATVFLDYQGEKAEAAFSDYISQLAAVEKVEFFDNNMK